MAAEKNKAKGREFEQRFERTKLLKEEKPNQDKLVLLQEKTVRILLTELII